MLLSTTERKTDLTYISQTFGSLSQNLDLLTQTSEKMICNFEKITLYYAQKRQRFGRLGFWISLFDFNSIHNSLCGIIFNFF